MTCCKSITCRDSIQERIETRNRIETRSCAVEPKFTVSAHVSRSVGEVFEAVADPDRLSAYFTTGGAKGRLETGAVVSWDFHDFPGAFPVKVIEVEQDKRIVLQWEANE